MFNDGQYIVIGDATGNIKTFDVKTGKCIQSFLNEATKKPISHISILPSPIEGEQIMAVNSYDNGIEVGLIVSTTGLRPRPSSTNVFIYAITCL